MNTDSIKVDLSKTQDIREVTDKLRAEHCIIQNESGDWVLLHHKDVVDAALDDLTFSSQVSRFLQLPNGLDGEEHTRYRRLIDSYLSAEALAPFAPKFLDVTNKLLDTLPIGQNISIDAVNDLGARFAVQAQCAWLGWDKTAESIETQLLGWMQHNHQATRSKQLSQTAKVAEEFDDIIRQIIAPYRQVILSEPSPTNEANELSEHCLDFTTVTAQLCQEKLDGDYLSEQALVSILRNWTGGDLGSMALCIGVVMAYLAKNPEQIRVWQTASDGNLELFINEVLRLDNPFVSNRRVTTCPVHIAGQQLPKGARVHLNWTSANRDEAVFDNHQFEPQKNAPNNLVYGIGRHACPGRLLATLQLVVLFKALLKRVQHIELTADSENAPQSELKPAVEREYMPLGGYSQVNVILT